MQLIPCDKNNTFSLFFSANVTWDNIIFKFCNEICWYLIIIIIIIIITRVSIFNVILDFEEIY